VYTIKTENKNKKKQSKKSLIESKKTDISKDTGCFKKMCVYCLLECDKRNKSLNTYILQGFVKVESKKYLYYN
jgi:hypothetical protein